MYIHPIEPLGLSRNICHPFPLKNLSQSAKSLLIFLDSLKITCSLVTMAVLPEMWATSQAYPLTRFLKRKRKSRPFLRIRFCFIPKGLLSYIRENKVGGRGNCRWPDQEWDGEMGISLCQNRAIVITAKSLEGWMPGVRLSILSPFSQFAFMVLT